MKKELKKDQILGAAGAIFSSKSKLFAATVTQGLNKIMSQIKEELESDLPFMDHLKLRP